MLNYNAKCREDLHVATKKSAEKSNVSKDELLKFYREMLLIRRFEEKAGQLYGMGLIGGFCHLYIGQEAVVVGLEACTKEGDKRITSYRDHGHMLACGMDPKGVMAELTGRSGGYSKGKGGSMHMFSREKHFYGGHGIVGAQVPLGTGLAFADKYHGNDNVTFTYFGDGAANQGQVYESYNMAELWALPVIFVIENNGYAMGTSIKRSTKSTTFFGRGAAYGIPGEQVDGMDVLAVKAAGQKAVAHCRAGKGPYILEMMTYRYRGEISHARGGRKDQDRERRDRAFARIVDTRRSCLGRRTEGHRQDDQGDRQRKRRIRQEQPRARAFRALDRYLRLRRAENGNRSINACAVSHNGRGNAGEMAGQRG
jgi:pyruvate dehydrogenase E1 component alpha subunit